MNKGIYIAVSGSVLKQLELEMIAQNLANADTTGYKKQLLSFKDYLLDTDPFTSSTDMKIMSSLSYLGTDFSMGSFIKTGNSLDVAIDGRGFIALEGGLYTRKGNLKRDSEGYLITDDGRRVLGDNGPIILPEGKVEIRDNAEVLVNGLPVGTIKVVDFKDYTKLERLPNGVYRTSEEGFEAEAFLRQGYLESSNVDVVVEMVRMIETLREFEAFQKVIQTLDEAAAKVNNELGRI